MKNFVLNSPDAVGTWVAERSGGEWFPGRGWAFGVVGKEGQLIAGVIFDSWNGASLHMHVAAEPGVNWISRRFLHLVFSYPFVQLKCKKVLGVVGSGNTAAQRLDEHLGFELEATLTDAHPDGALLVYSMRKEDCRWLNIFERKPHEQTQSTTTT